MFDSHGEVSRRALILGGLGAALPRRSSALTGAGKEYDRGHRAIQPMAMQQSPVAQDPSVGRLGNPWVAGQPRARPNEFDNDPYIIELERRLKCNCGCAHSLYACRTTDFSCQFWQPLHAQVIEMVKQDMTAEEIIDAYVMEHGTQYLMAPTAEGFNLAGYLVPGVLISITAVGMAWLLQRKNQLAAAPVEVPPVPTSSEFSDEDEARLAEELSKLQI